MNPYHERDGISIYHGDCLAILRDLRDAGIQVDAVITDVPYASGARTEAKKNASGAMLRGERWAAKPIENDQMTTAGFIWFIRELALVTREMLPDGGNWFTFIDWRQWPHLIGALESVNLRVNQCIVWDKQSFGLGHGFRSQHEFGCHASKGTATVFDHSTGNVLPCRRAENSRHPSPKPVDLLHRIIRVLVPPGGVVLDPCMGCGPVLEAAKATGRRAIGIDCVEQYCADAAERLRQGFLAIE